MDEVVREIEDAFVAHWSQLGQLPGTRLVDEDGVLRFETPIRKLPYNGVIRTSLAEGRREVVDRVVGAYAERGVEFYWVVHPSATPADLGDWIEAAGLAPVELGTGMSLDVVGWTARERSSDVAFAEVVDAAGLAAYVDLTMDYWELEEADREVLTQLNRDWSRDPPRGRRWLALVDGLPVGKGYLSLVGPPGVAAIYGMSVRRDARGRGIAGALTDVLVAQAQSLGYRRVVLHASEMAVGVYRRAGFVERCELRFFGTAPVWSGKQ